MKKLVSIPIIITISFMSSRAQIPLNGLDVQHYNYEIFLNDTTDIIRGIATITVKFTGNMETVNFDLALKTPNGKGMRVLNVTGNGSCLEYIQDLRHLIITDSVRKGDIKDYTIIYEGVPADGLIIGKNKYGHRAFFADNWPDRAHNWIPCNDHVSDKASVDFIVTAPDHYNVISNGVITDESMLPGKLKITHYHDSLLLPVKIMVIGVADFAVEEAGWVNKIQVSSWVYPEDTEPGFYDYAQAVDILPYFIGMIGPYPYPKLANVESMTIFGGMENASAIFFDENSITGTRRSESLLAHEIAHQWFGDAVTETDWPHIWLSEGFATCMTNLYLERRYGVDTMNSILKADRGKIIRYSKRNNTPVVDTTNSDNLMKLLNINSYEKGGWILHMLRRSMKRCWTLRSGWIQNLKQSLPIPM